MSALVYREQYGSCIVLLSVAGMQCRLHTPHLHGFHFSHGAESTQTTKGD